jgi:uncharacterized small protein (DUF1192 family)
MSIDLEELEPRRRAPQPKNLELMGVEELEHYIATLETEIQRVRREIEVKRSRRTGAEALFKR